MPTLHHSLGTSGLRLRTERGVQTLALANRGPLLDGAYETAAALEAAEAGRVVAEIALDTPGALCLAVDDGGTLLPRDPGDPNPQYTLYRVARVPQEGIEPIIAYGNATRLEALNEPCDYASLWTLTSPAPATSADDPLDSAAGWTLGNPARLGLLDDGLDTATGWILVPSIDATPETVPAPAAAIARATLSYTEQLAADIAASAPFAAALRLWCNSNGPFLAADGAIFAWTALRPDIEGGFHFGPPLYDRAAANGRGELPTAQPGVDLFTYCGFSAALGWDAAAAWTLFLVGRQHALPAVQQCLFAANGLGDPASQYPAIEVHGGTATAGVRVACAGSSRTFDSALPTTTSILEISAGAGASIHAWEARINGAALTQSATAGTGPAPAWAGAYPARIGLFGGVYEPNFRGALSEIVLIQTDDATTRAAVRAYLAAKFAITVT